MTTSTSKVTPETEIKTEKPSHIVIVTIPIEGNIVFNEKKPKEFHSLPEATKWCEEQIRTNPGMQCDIYQLRTELVGEIKIHQTHYNS